MSSPALAKLRQLNRNDYEARFQASPPHMLLRELELVDDDWTEDQMADLVFSLGFVWTRQAETVEIPGLRTYDVSHLVQWKQRPAGVPWTEFMTADLRVLSEVWEKQADGNHGYTITHPDPVEETDAFVAYPATVEDQWGRPTSAATTLSALDLVVAAMTPVDTCGVRIKINEGLPSKGDLRHAPGWPVWAIREPLQSVEVAEQVIAEEAAPCLDDQVPSVLRPAVAAAAATVAEKLLDAMAKEHSRQPLLHAIEAHYEAMAAEEAEAQVAEERAKERAERFTTDEAAARLVIDDGMSVSAAATESGINRTLLSKLVKVAKEGPALRDRGMTPEEIKAELKSELGAERIEALLDALAEDHNAA